MIGSLRRSKMVSFRLSSEEYQRFQSICQARGIRSLSDLARTAVQRMASSQHHSDPLWQELGDLRNQVRFLSLELDRLSKVLESRQTQS